MRRYFYELKLFVLKFFGSKRKYYTHCYYKETVEKYKNIDSYLTLYERSKNSKYFRTNTEICFSKDLKFGCTLKDITDRLHKPNFQIQTNKSTNIFFYRLFLGNHKVRCKMHFLDKKLFLYSYSFSNTDPKVNDEIISIINKKYSTDLDSNTRKIIFDNHNNCIQIENDVELKIHYFFVNSEFFKTIAIISEQEAIRQRERIERNYRAIYCKI